VIFPVAGVTLDEFNAEKASYTQAIANTLDVNETQVSVNATELSERRRLVRRRLQGRGLEMVASVLANNGKEVASITQKAEAETFSTDLSENIENEGVIVSSEQIGPTTVTTQSVWTSAGTTQTWRSIPSSADGTQLAAVVLGGNIWTSADSGSTWSEDTSVGSTQQWYSITSSADGTLLVAVVRGGSIWTSADGGSTWSEDTSVGSPQDWVSVTSSAGGTQLAAVVLGGNIWTSADSGSTWSEDTSVGSTQQWVSIASSADGTRLVAAVFAGNIWLSADGGSIWIEDTSVGSTQSWAAAPSADSTQLAAVVNAGILAPKSKIKLDVFVAEVGFDVAGLFT
jgi:photosystem II stability/assembly factor-like uncharacterized protein